MKKILFSLLALSTTVTTPAMADLSRDYQDNDSAYDMCVAHSSSNRTIWENDNGAGAIITNKRVYLVPAKNASHSGSNSSYGANYWPHTWQQSGTKFNCNNITYNGKYGVQESKYVSGVSVGQYYFSGGTFTNLWKVETQGDTRVLVRYEQKDGGETNKVIYR